MKRGLSVIGTEATNRRVHAALLAFGVGLLGAFLISGITAAPAPAQATAFCQQYPGDPSCPGDGGPIAGDVGPSGGSGLFIPSVNELVGTEAGSATSGTAKGELPFTGYPLSWLILFLLLLLAAGLLLRACLALRHRRDGNPADSVGSGRFD